MSHFYTNPEDAQKLVDMVGDNDITTNISDEKDEESAQETFEAVHRLTMSACDLYCDGTLKWDEMISQLSASLLKLKGKEAELQKMEEEEESPEDENEEEDIEE